MNVDGVKIRIEQLRKDIEKYNYNYYNLDKSIISDFDFDKKLRELEELEKQYPQYSKEDSPTNKVGGGISKNFETKPHTFPMLSLPNAYSKEELIDFHHRVKRNLKEENIEYTCELKFDGVAVAIRYENGIIKDALTRGNGIIGDDITENVKTIKNVPLRLSGDFPNFLEVRGEVIISKQNFEQLNKLRSEKGLNIFANPRNFASGSLKMLDSSEVAKRKLEFKVYSCNLNKNDDQYSGISHFQLLNDVKKWGFSKVDDIVKVASIDEVLEFIYHWDKQRYDLSFLVDGIVIKVNSIDYQNKLGKTSKFPRWAIAFKFGAEKKSTLIKSIEYQVGRTGAITPVAILEPIALSGTIVKRASLHNFSFLEKFNLRKNDRVWVEKGGDIIPKIISVDLESRDKDSPKFKQIDECPSCYSKLYREEKDPVKYCLNQNCNDKHNAILEHFISQKAMDIRNIGKETMQQLFYKNIVKDISDIYYITIDNLMTLDGISDKSANNIMKSISQSKNVDINRFIYSLGIRHVGIVSANKLAKHFANLDNIINASYEKLLEVDEIGDKIAKSVRDYFDYEHNIELISKLKNAGVNIIDYKYNNTSGKLANKSFLISGVFEDASRKQIKDIIERNGGRNVSSISKKTDYLIVGDKPGKSKIDKAKEFEVEIITKKYFDNMI